MTAIQKSILTIFVIAALGFFGFRALFQDSFKPSTAVLNNQFENMKQNGIPEFHGTLVDGGPFQLSKSTQKQVIIVNFWASWCGPCVEEFPSMIKLVRQFNGKVKLVAVSLDNQKKDMTDFLNIYAAGKEPHVTLLWDPDSKISDQFGTDRLPESYVVTGDLKLLKKVAGSIDWLREDVVQFMKDELKESTK